MRDRTQQETIELIRGIVTLTIETGPRAGLARTFQAFNALSITIQDFLPAQINGFQPYSIPTRIRIGVSEMFGCN